MIDLSNAIALLQAEFADVPNEHWLLLGVVTAVGMLIGAVQDAKRVQNRQGKSHGASRAAAIFRN